jgi:CheY-like chemotaxis protein
MKARESDAVAQEMTVSLTRLCPKCQSAQPVQELLEGGRWAMRCETCQTRIEDDLLEAQSAPRPTVLCIDDDRLLLSLCCDALEREGYRAIIATDGPSGIETAKAARPDVILLDVVMPEMDGLEVCSRLRAIHEFQKTPIILLTALNDLKLDAKGLAAGATLTLRKPFGPALIMATIRQILGRESRPTAPDR